MLTSNQKEIIFHVLKPYHPKKLGVFGSYARGENTSTSDLDLLVEFGVPINLFDLIGLEQDLSERLGMKVDLVTERSLSQFIKPYIEKDFRSLLP